MISTGIFVPASNTPRVAKQDVSCVASLFLAAPCVTFAVTTDAKLDQVVHHIATELAPAFYVVDLQAFHGTALLTPPTISFEHACPDDCVFFRIQFEPGLLLT